MSFMDEVFLTRKLLLIAICIVFVVAFIFRRLGQFRACQLSLLSVGLFSIVQGIGFLVFPGESKQIIDQFLGGTLLAVGLALIAGAVRKLRILNRLRRKAANHPPRPRAGA